MWKPHITKRHLVAFIIGSLLATVARSGTVKDYVRSVAPHSFTFRSASHTQPRAMVLEGELPVCSAVVDGDTLYTAGHCVRWYKEGDEVEVLLQTKGEPTRQKVYLQKVYSDIAILSFSKEAKIEPPTAVKVEAGARVVAVMGILFSSDAEVYRASLPYFEREGKVLAVFTARELGLTEIDPNIPPTAKFALIDIGSFGGNSGSGVYIVDEQGKRHLIGVVSAGVSDYTAVALF
jgi:hypothetical protein